MTYQQEWYQKNIERERKRARDYYQKHKKERNEYKKRWKAEKLKDTQYRIKNRAYFRKYNQKYRSRPEIKEKARLWRKKHYEENRLEIRKRSHNRIKELRDRLFDVLGSHVCVRCGFSDKRALQFDHINGGGRKEIQNLDRKTFYMKYISSPELARKTLQVLCSNCNWIKVIENKERKSIYI